MAVALLELFYVIAIVVGLLVSGLLLRKKSNKDANVICAIYIFCLLIPLWNGYVYYNPELSPLSIRVLNLVYPWFFGPCIYLYCKSLYGEGKPLLQSIKHFVVIPVIMALYGLYVFVPEIMSRRAYWLIFNIGFFTHVFGYAFLTAFFLIKRRSRIENFYATIDPYTTKWLSALVYGFIVIFIFDLLLLTVKIADIGNQRWFSDLFIIGESVYIMILGGIALMQPEQLLDPHFDNKYKNSSLSRAQAQELAQDLLNRVEKEQWYLESDINLGKMASRLNAANHHLSQVLSEEIGQSFYEFINRHRVNYAKQLLAQNDANFGNILDVAHTVGFNNKSSFNSAFKRFTKLTPSQFRSSASA